MSFPWKTSLASIIIAGGATVLARHQFKERSCTPLDYTVSTSAFENADAILREEFARDPCGSASSIITHLDNVKPSYRSSYFYQAVSTLEHIAPKEGELRAHRDCPLESLAHTYVGERLDEAQAYAENKEYERRDWRAKEALLSFVIGLSAFGFGVNSVRAYVKERSMGIPG